MPMLRRDGRHNLVEDLSSTVAGCLVAVSGSAWCALEPGLADPAIVVPTCLALFVGAVLTVLNVRARMLEADVVADVRDDVIRFGFGLYQDAEDVDRLIAACRTL